MSDNGAQAWADRRTRTGHETAGKLAKMYNRQNYRLHPEQQQQAVEASLDDLGNFDAVKVSEVTEQVIDGHLRIELALMRFGEDFRIPVDYYDLDETETKKALMYRDLTAQMAEINVPALQELRFELPDFDNPAFDEFLTTEFDFDFGGDGTSWGDAFGKLPDSDRAPFQQMTFTLHDSQVEIVTAALTQAKQGANFEDTPNENSNGNALALICERFTNGNG